MKYKGFSKKDLVDVYYKMVLILIFCQFFEVENFPTISLDFFSLEKQQKQQGV